MSMCSSIKAGLVNLCVSLLYPKMVVSRSIALGVFQVRGPVEHLVKEMCAITAGRLATGSQTAQGLGLRSNMLEAGM